MKAFLTFVLVFYYIFQRSTHHVIGGYCNTCSGANNLACVSQTQFQICIGAYPSGPINSCPTGYVCSTANATICQPNQPDAVIDCNDCNRCDNTNTFACTGLRTFALCLGTTVPSNILSSCAPYHVCSINYPQICGNATMGITATCPSVDGTVTTVATTSTTRAAAASFNATMYCRSLLQNGRFPVPIEVDSTCKQYVYCFINNGIWYGQLYICPGRTYFDVSSRLCNTTVPTQCF